MIFQSFLKKKVLLFATSIFAASFIFQNIPLIDETCAEDSCCQEMMTMSCCEKSQEVTNNCSCPGMDQDNSDPSDGLPAIPTKPAVIKTIDNFTSLQTFNSKIPQKTLATSHYQVKLLSFSADNKVYKSIHSFLI